MKNEEMKNFLKKMSEIFKIDISDELEKEFEFIVGFIIHSLDMQKLK